MYLTESQYSFLFFFLTTYDCATMQTLLLSPSSSSITRTDETIMNKENVPDEVKVVLPLCESKSPFTNKRRLSFSNIHNQQQLTTPPRLKMNIDDNSEEDFSFAKLKGTVQNFEQKQKAHYESICNHSNNSSSSNGNGKESYSNSNSLELKTKTNINESNNNTNDSSTSTHITSCSSLGTIDSNELSPTSSLQQSDSKDKNHDIESTRQRNSNDDNIDKEDFSFQKLKQKAVGMEASSIKKNGHKINEEVEDFSFANLRQKALMTTPSKRLGGKTIAPSTPFRNSSYKKSQHRVVPHTICGKGCRPTSSIIAPIPFSLQNRSNSAPKTRPRVELDVNIGSKTSVNVSEKKNHSTSKSTFNPNRFQFKPKIKKEEIQATNDTHASVKKLSQWLSDDPFEKKKQLLIRKGEQIANKAKIFEAEEVLNETLQLNCQSRAQRERQYFPEGKVSNGKDWLKNHAFGDKTKSHDSDDSDQNCGVMEKKKQIEAALKMRSTKKRC